MTTSYNYRYRPTVDHRLRFPLSVAAFYLETNRKDILTEALACMLENMLELAIFDSKKGNPQSIIEKQDIPILQDALERTRKVLQRFGK